MKERFIEVLESSQREMVECLDASYDLGHQAFQSLCRDTGCKSDISTWLSNQRLTCATLYTARLLFIQTY